MDFFPDCFPVKDLCAGLVMLTFGLLPVQAQQEDEPLEQMFQEYLEGLFQLSPLEASRLGDHRFDHLLDDLSAPARAARADYTRKMLRELPQRVDYQALSRGAQIDFEIFQQDLQRRIWLEEQTRPFAEDPLTYNRYITGSIHMLLTQSTLPLEENVAHAVARMAEIPKAVRAARETLTHPPRPLVETAILQNRGAIRFYEAGIYELAGESSQREALQAAGAEVLAALREYQAFLEGELLDRATGGWRLGRELFSKKLDLILDADLSAEEVLQYAEEEFQRVHQDMYVIARQLWSRHFPARPLPPDDPEGRRQTIREVTHAVSQEHGKPEELLVDARATVDRIRSFIRERDILRLPEPDRCEVIEMPEFQRGNSLAYFRIAPPLDAQAASFYAVSPPPADWDAGRVKSFLEEYNHHMLQILTIHEAYPGHYVQLDYANRVPSLIRRVLSSGPFVEGWAVYTEQMMLDQGYGDGDLPLRLMQLKFYLRAITNAILDHKLHCEEMADEEALQLMMEGAFQSEGEARLKLIRAKQSSTQLSTYFVGRMALYRLRQQVQRELGEEFQLGRYHEAVLAHGSVPIKYLPELVRARLQQPRD